MPGMRELLSQSLFFEISAILVLAAAIGIVGHLLHPPLIVSFIAVGIIAGPSALDISRSSEKISVLSELGIAILLFLVGLKLDVKLVSSLGAVSLSTGLGQVAFTSVIGFVLCLGLGFDPVASLYISVALTFSSTIIIVKLLSDKREVDSLHGQIALGFLIVQDIVVVLAMIVLSAIGIGMQSESSWRDVRAVFASGGIMLAGVMLFIRFVATPLTEILARRPDYCCFSRSRRRARLRRSGSISDSEKNWEDCSPASRLPRRRIARRWPPAWRRSGISCCCSSSSRSGPSCN